MVVLLDDNRFVFSDDGQSFHMCCKECKNVPCVWVDNQQSMIDFDQADNYDKDAESNKCCHGLYQQMTLIINGGPTCHGVRLKLPTCILTGVLELSQVQIIPVVKISSDVKV
jgi:hypothetical protein